MNESPATSGDSQRTEPTSAVFALLEVTMLITFVGEVPGIDHEQLILGVGRAGRHLATKLTRLHAEPLDEGVPLFP